MKSSFFLKCVWLIQLLPRRCAPQPFRAGSPRWFLYVFMYGVVRQDAPPAPTPQRGGVISEIEKPSKNEGLGVIRKYAAGLLI